MRRHFQLSMLCLAVGLASACSDPETIVKTENIPTAGFRFINAVPDTNAMDLRFIDIVENSAHYQIGFRNGPASTNVVVAGVTVGAVTGSNQIEYKNTRAGSRHFRIFLNGTTTAVASTVLKDTTVTLEAGKTYTAIMQGPARSGGMSLVVYEEVVADPAANVGLRVINTTANPIDARTYPASGTAPAAPTWAVPAYSRSAFVTAAPAQMKFNVMAAGGAVALFPDLYALIGAPASSSAGTTTLDIEGLPGTTQAGSAVTAIVFPPSVVGSNAAQFLTAGVPQPGMSFMWDRRPPRPAGT